MNRFEGNPVSQGVAVGHVMKYIPYQASVDEILLLPDQVAEEMALYREARSRAETELEMLRAGFGEEETEKRAIISAHMEIINDPALDQMVSGSIEKEYYNVKWAIEHAFSQFIEMLSSVQDDMIRERITDMKDVKGRLLRNCDDIPDMDPGVLKEPQIVVAEELFPSAAASLDPLMVKAIVAETGGATSHTAIIARHYQIPALLCVTGAMSFLENGEMIGVDATEGFLVADLDVKTMEHYQKRAEAYWIHRMGTEGGKEHG